MDGSRFVCFTIWREVVRAIVAGRGNGDENGISLAREVFQQGASGDSGLRAGGLGLLGWY